MLVPYRPQEGTDRAAQLEQLLNALRRHLPPAVAAVVVAEQSDDGRPFHRGALLNAAAVFAEERYRPDFMIAHDCDLLPDPAVARLYLVPRPLVCLAACEGVRYSSSPTYCGGVTGFTPAAFRKMNGYPVDDAFGWGGEDDELRRRAGYCGIKVERNTAGRYTDLEGMNLAEKLAWLRERPHEKNMKRYELRDQSARTWRRNGLRGGRVSPRVVDVEIEPLCVRLRVDIIVRPP